LGDLTWNDPMRVLCKPIAYVLKLLYGFFWTRWRSGFLVDRMLHVQPKCLLSQKLWHWLS